MAVYYCMMTRRCWERTRCRTFKCLQGGKRLYNRVIGGNHRGNKGSVREESAYPPVSRLQLEKQEHHISIFGTAWVLGFPLSETSIENDYNLRRIDTQEIDSCIKNKDPLPRPFQMQSHRIIEQSQLNPHLLPATAVRLYKPHEPLHCPGLPRAVAPWFSSPFTI